MADRHEINFRYVKHWYYSYHKSQPSKKRTSVCAGMDFGCSCTALNPLIYGEPIVKVIRRTFTGKAKSGRQLRFTEIMRWRIPCAQMILPGLFAVWAEKEPLWLSDYERDKWQSAHPFKEKRPGNKQAKGKAAVEGLTDEQRLERHRLLVLHGKHVQTRASVISEVGRLSGTPELTPVKAAQLNLRLLKAKAKLTEIYQRVEVLGGVPNKWKEAVA